MSDDAFEIIPPARSGDKYKLIITRKHDVPLIEPPRVCIVCEQERNASAFTPTRNRDRSPICNICKRPVGVRGLPWVEGLNWADAVAYNDAMTLAKIIERECAR